MKQTGERKFTANIAVHATGPQNPKVSHIQLNVGYDLGRYLLTAYPAETHGDNWILLITRQQWAILTTARRFNSKELARQAVRVQRALDNANDKENSTWVLIAEVCTLNNLAVTTPATGKTRAQIIDEILAASRRPVPEIVETVTMLCDDGKYRNAFGLPHGVHFVDPVERRSEGFVYRSSEGTTSGKRHASHQAALDNWNDAEDVKAADFRVHLESASDQELGSQAIYWMRQAKAA